MIARRLLPVILAPGLAACGARAPAGDPLAEAATLERSVVAATAPKAPFRLLFEWTARDRDARFAGRGVTRVEPPYRGRLDLFGPRGEGYLSAVIVDDDLRLPALALPVPLPPPALMWSTMGVLRPPAAARLVTARRDGDKIIFEYAGGQDRWRFELENGRMHHAELESPTRGRHTVELKDVDERGLPGQAVYRDWRAFFELVLTLTETRNVESFPPEIWTLGRP